MSLVEQIRQVATSRHALGEVGALLRELLSELGSAHAGRPWPDDRPSRERGAREERS